MPPPLLVHLLFHPASAAARSLALELHRALNDDPLLPGLRIPTVIACEDGTNLPPLRHTLNEAERSVVVPIVDDVMLLEQTRPSSRQSWAAFIGDLWAECEQSRHRFIPIQLSENAWPLDPRLSQTNFVRAFAEPNESRPAWTTRRIVVELCRYLEGETRGERLPVRLFLSHAKSDIHSEPQVFNELVEHLKATQPVKTWVDSAEIEAGSRFSSEIAKGVRESIVLVLATKSYGARPWCRRELLFAKQEQRPFVVVEALEGVEARSFPYAGNAPKLRWTRGAAAQAVDLVLKETLRHLHATRVLERDRRSTDVVLAAPPELTTVVRLPRGATIFYPDPPLGDEEVEELAPLGHRIETPLQRAASNRSLAAVPIVVSISESSDVERHGLFPAHLDAALLEISRQLLVRGASLEYGGHLGSEGYTVALFNMVKAYSSLSGLPPVLRILNDVGWPLPYEALPVATRTQHHMVASYRRVPRPAGVEDLEPETFVDEPTFFPPSTPERRYAWARGMTAMREFQVRPVQADDAAGPEQAAPRGRILLGGKVGPTATIGADGTRELRWYSGRIPGVVEEALLSLRAEQPLYLVGGFGGAAALVIDLLEKRPREEFTWKYQSGAPHAEGMRRIYEQRGPAWEDYPAMTEVFAELGVDRLAARNGLSVDQNRELFRCRDVTRILELLLEGLGHVS